jgi:hypothetical protein
MSVFSYAGHCRIGPTRFDRCMSSNRRLAVRTHSDDAGLHPLLSLRADRRSMCRSEPPKRPRLTLMASAMADAGRHSRCRVSHLCQVVDHLERVFLTGTGSRVGDQRRAGRARHATRAEPAAFAPSSRVGYACTLRFARSSPIYREPIDKVGNAVSLFFLVCPYA